MKGTQWIALNFGGIGIGLIVVATLFYEVPDKTIIGGEGMILIGLALGAARAGRVEADVSPLADCDGDTRGWVKHDGSDAVPAAARRAPRLIDIVLAEDDPISPGWTMRRFRPENVPWRRVSHWRVCIVS